MSSRDIKEWNREHRFASLQQGEVVKFFVGHNGHRPRAIQVTGPEGKNVLGSPHALPRRYQPKSAHYTRNTPNHKNPLPTTRAKRTGTTSSSDNTVLTSAKTVGGSHEVIATKPSPNNRQEIQTNCQPLPRRG